jgi:hypothetical protein
MLIMPCRASASRCRVQVTSNVRHPRTKIQMQDMRFGTVPLEMSPAKVARTGRRGSLTNCSVFSESGNSNHKIRWVAQAPAEQSPARHGPSMVRQAGHTQSKCSRWLTLFRQKAACGSIQSVVSTRSPFARMPNPSVNLTRNSVPRWPSEARYAHYAPLVQQVRLPRAGYLKR